MFNKNFYTGAPVIGIYEMRRLDELEYRPSTRKIAKEFSTFTSNIYNFTLNTKRRCFETCTIKSYLLWII